ncbi:hypothetical protein MKD33_11100, partial [Chromobacterium piscinae]
METAPQPA